jgi:phosphatidylglycerophosphate synthase
MTPKNLNYFSEKEVKSVQKFTDFRTNLAKPLLRLFDYIHITPNILSFVSFLMIFGFVYFANTNIYYAVLFIVLHVLFDSLDGSLARYQKITSNQGAFVDIFVDQSAIIIGVLTMIYHSLINPFWGALYGIFYVIMIMLMVILNYKEHSIKFILRTKYFFFIILLIDTYFKIQIINYFLMIIGIYMVLVSTYMFNKLRKLL